MFRTAAQFAFTLSVCLLLTGIVHGEEIESVLGYKASIKDSWTYFDVHESRNLGLQKAAADEIRKMGKSAGNSLISKEIDKISATDVEFILLDKESLGQRDNINIRMAQGRLPINTANATALRKPMQDVLPRLVGGPVVVNSTQLVQLPKSNAWALVMNFHVTLQGIRHHQVQYLVGSRPGAPVKLVVGGTFFSSGDDSHRSTMSNFMNTFSLTTAQEKRLSVARSGQSR